jgi:hypothetical protein
MDEWIKVRRDTFDFDALFTSLNANELLILYSLLITQFFVWIFSRLTYHA